MNQVYVALREGDGDAVSRVYNLAPVLVFGTYLLHGLYQYLAYPMDFRTVCHAYGDNGQLVRVVARQVVEVLVLPALSGVVKTIVLTVQRYKLIMKVPNFYGIICNIHEMYNACRACITAGPTYIIEVWGT